MSDELKEVKKTKKDRYVSKTQFESLEKSVSDLVTLVNEVLSKKETPAQTVTHTVETTTLPNYTTTASTDDGAPQPDDKMPIPPKWRTVVDEVLGQDFGISVSYPDSGSGFKFTIMVPREKSNASSSHWDMYKHDNRTIALDSSQGIDGIKRWCEKIKKNLEVAKQ